MRATVQSPIRKTIDLTSSTPHIRVAPVPSRGIRAARSIVDTVADAIMATGGILLANVSLDLKLGLPQGIGGIAMGVAMLGIGAAIALARRVRTVEPDPATTMWPAESRVIVLDEPRTEITLDERVTTAARSAAARRRAA